MKRMLSATSVALLVCTATPSTAQQPTGQPQPVAGPTLRLSDAVAAVLAQHPLIDAADAALARARSGVREVEAARYPGLSVDASGIRFQKPMVVAPLHGFNPLAPPEFDRLLLQGMVTASYTLFDAGARDARITRAEAHALAAATGVEAAQQSLLARTAIAYNAVSSTRQIQHAQGLRTAAVLQERERAQLLLAEGKVARVILLRADAALAAARAEGTSADAAATDAERELARLMGTSADVIARSALAALTPPETYSIDRTSVLSRAALHNSELRRLHAQLAAAHETLREVRSTRLPRVQLGARLSEFASTNGFASSEWQTGVQLSYPVFTGGATSAAAQRASAEVAGAQAEIRLAELRIAEAVDGAVAAAASARARVLAFGEAAVQQEEVVRIERLSLRAGTGAQTDYLSAEAELFRVRAAVTQARAELVRAFVELARITGELSTDWLTTNLERTP